LKLAKAVDSSSSEIEPMKRKFCGAIAALFILCTSQAFAGFSSGLTAITTANNNWTAVTLTYDAGTTRVRELTIVNKGSNAGFIRFGGGAPHYVPADAARVFKFEANDIGMAAGVTVEVKNASDGSNLSSVYISGL
jgi:hypothetical protein